MVIIKCNSKQYLLICIAEIMLMMDYQNSTSNFVNNVTQNQNVVTAVKTKHANN